MHAVEQTSDGTDRTNPLVNPEIFKTTNLTHLKEETLVHVSARRPRSFIMMAMLDAFWEKKHLILGSFCVSKLMVHGRSAIGTRYSHHDVVVNTSHAPSHRNRALCGNGQGTEVFCDEILALVLLEI
jgi:hypothetical protein